ncbi:hypothetical protein DQ04_12041020 [Trypanosoma grayi]|uniref:hypothetical protein n=1 Tax=Trypanosoma grayi TaxID=71804 RepID=UPI0004F4AB71|nr:hypothetical protein DQ04_12041020 [Trypanosoma grayi]KEG06826.1 hypothetical protein DQ04_12041020 [Trypanosoma grayi]
MLRHVLCLVVLTLCCCTSVCVAAAGAPQEAGKLQLVNGGATITLTETVETGNCTASPPPPPATGVNKDVTISTKVALRKKEGESQEPTEMANGPSMTVKVPDGYKLTLKTSLDVKCTKKAGDSSSTAGKSCPVTDTKAADSDTITYVVAVKPTTSDQPAVNTPETQNHEVKVPPEHDVNIVAKLVAACVPPPTSEPPLPTIPKANPDPREKDTLDSKLPDLGPTSPESPPLDDDSITTERRKGKTQEGAQLPQDGTKSLDTATSREKVNGERTGGEKGSDASNKVTPPTSSEAEGTETDNSVTVSDADHTAPTATPQSGTNTEGAPNADAGTSTSAGEGVNLPDRNTDASSSSSTAWVRAPLLLLLACVAVL